MPARVHRGFTVVELMLVVTILGVLSSVAIPSFFKMEFRAKQAERNVMMIAIERSIDDYYARENHYPTPVGAVTYLYLTAANPDAAPTASKRPWRRTAADPLDHWNKLSLVVQGAVYYSYEGLASEESLSRYTWLRATGDLDGDGVQDVLDRYWRYSGTTLQRVAGTTCNDCSEEVRTPASGMAF